MLPVFTYHKFPYTIIRPLALVYEKDIIKFAKQKNINNLICRCPYGKNSKRLHVRKAIAGLSAKEDSVRYMIFKAMHNVNLSFLNPDIDNRDPDTDRNPDRVNMSRQF